MFDNKIYAVDVFMPALALGEYLDPGNHYDSFLQLIINVSDVKVGRLLVYKKGRKFKEIITGIEIPYILYSSSNCKYYLSGNCALYFRVLKHRSNFKYDAILSRNNKYIALNRHVATSDELENYIESKKDLSNYKTDKNYTNYIEAYKEEIMEMFLSAENRYKELLEKYRIYCKQQTDTERAKVKSIRAKYKV